MQCDGEVLNHVLDSSCSGEAVARAFCRSVLLTNALLAVFRNYEDERLQLKAKTKRQTLFGWLQREEGTLGCCLVSPPQMPHKQTRFSTNRERAKSSSPLSVLVAMGHLSQSSKSLSSSKQHMRSKHG